jgi:hypothetical protein
MYSARGKTWRPRLFDAPARPAPPCNRLPVPSPEPRSGPQRVWAFLCPNPICGTELVIFPEHSGQTVACPTCGWEFVAPRIVPLQIAAEDDEDRPLGRAFAPGAVIAMPPRPPAAPPASPESRKAAGALEILASKGIAPPAVSRAAPAPPMPATFAPSGLPAAEARKAADALDALALAAAQYNRQPAPPKGAERRAEPRVNVAPTRRIQPRVELAVGPLPRRSPLPARQRADLVLTWVVAVVVSAGLALAAWAVAVPDLVLGSVLFVGLAAIRTFLVLRAHGAPRPPG